MLQKRSVLLTFGLMAVSCTASTGPEFTRIGDIHTIGCKPEPVVGDLARLCLEDAKNPVIEIADRPAGPDSVTIFVPWVHSPPDSARFMLDIFDSLSEQTYLFVSPNFLQPGSSVADTLGLPPINHAFDRVVTLRLVLTEFRAKGTNITPYDDTTFVWRIDGLGGPGIKSQALFRSTFSPN